MARVGLSGAAVAVVATLLGPALVPAMASTSLSSGEQQVLDLLNDRRARAGLASLPVHDELMADARAWAAEMARRGDISHSPPPPGDWQRYSENVGMGTDLAIVQREFEASGTHDHTMVDPSWTHVGVAEARGADGNVYVVQKFATYPVAAPAPRPAAVSTPAPPAAPAPAPPPAPAPEPVAAADTAAPALAAIPHRDVRAAAGVIGQLRTLRTLDTLSAPGLPLRTS